MKEKLTKSVIDKAQYKGKQCKGGSWTRCVIWDATLPGFGLRVVPSGKKFFILKYRKNGRPRQIDIGDYPTLTVDLARAKVYEHLSGLQIKDVDPLSVKEEKRARNKALVGQLIQEYIERHAKAHKKSWKKDKERLDAYVLPAWKARPVSSITRNDVALLHGKIGAKTPYLANRIVEVIRKMFSLAEAWGYLPAGAPNPARGIERYKETKRDRWVSETELPKLAKEIDAQENVYVRAALWLYLLTGLRRLELLRAKWEHIDTNNKTLYVPETKNGKAFTAYLSAAAMAIIENIPRLEGNPYVFPGQRKGKPLFSIQRQWEQIRKAAEMEDVRLHDLRRTLGSMLACNGVPLLVIAKALGHSSTAPTEIYARLSQDPVKAAIEAHGQRLMVAAGKKAPAEIIDYQEAKRGHSGR